MSNLSNIRISEMDKMKAVESDISILLNYYSHHPLAFSLLEILDDLDRLINPNVIEARLAEDQRFVVVRGSLPEEDLIISEQRLFLWYARLNLRHARVHTEKPIITINQLQALLSSLRIDGNWVKIPEEILEFGLKFGLITRTNDSKSLFLPLSNILSSIPANKNTRYYQDLSEECFISLANCTAKDRKALIDKFPENLYQEAFKFLDIRNKKRALEMAIRKEGVLSGKKETLEKIARDNNITRERVRQIIGGFWERFRNFPGCQKILFQGVILYVIKAGGSLLIDENSQYIHFLAKSCEIPICFVPNTNLYILGCSPTTSSQINHIFRAGDMALTHNDLISRLSGEITLPQKDIYFIAKSIEFYQQKHIKKHNLVLSALKAIGKPAHFSLVFEKFYQMFPEVTITEHSVHAILGRLNKIGTNVVWIGIKGTYALKEWGYECPSKGLFDIISEIVCNQYENNHNPVSINKIYTEISKYRQVVNKSSVTMAITLNENIIKVGKNHYIPIYNNNNRDDDQSDIDAKIHEGISSFLREKKEVSAGINARIDAGDFPQYRHKHTVIDNDDKEK